MTILIMIEKSRFYPQFQYAPERLQLDHFHNPYLAKLNIKLTPRPHIRTHTLLSPLSFDNNIYVSQSIPLYKDEKLKLALVWKEYLTHKYARAHFGLSADYKFDSSLKIRSKAMVGITSVFDLQLSNKFKHNFEGFVGYSGFFQNNNLFNSFHLGARKGILSAAFSKKVGGNTEATMAATKKLAHDVSLQAHLNCSLDELRKGQLQLMLNQKIDSKSSAALGVVATPYYSEGSLKVQYQRLVTKSEKIIVSTEYSEGKSVFYLGFKNLNFNFIFPFLAVDGVLPLFAAATAYGLTFLYRRYYGKKEQQGNAINIEDNPKTLQNRLEELQLIGEKAADHYERQKASRKGLRIQQAYLGPPGQLQQFIDNPQRFHLLIRSEQHKEKFIDLTVTLRFYVMKGELKLRKGQKNKLLGFYRKNNNQTRIGIRYIKNDEVKTKFFDYLDPIVITDQ